MESAAQPLIMVGMPTDIDTLAAIGRVAVRHGQLERAMRLGRRAFLPESVPEALKATERKPIGQVRKDLVKLAAQYLGEGERLERLCALLERADCVTSERNKLMHGLWGYQLDGGSVFSADDKEFGPVPLATDLDALALEIEDVTRALVSTRG